MIILLLFLLIIVKKIDTENQKKEELYTKSVIEYTNENTNIYVEYPRFNNDNINSLITNIIYSDINEFKTNNNKKTLNISFNIYNIEDYINIGFNISNSLNNIKYKNILIDFKKEKIAYITNLFDKKYLENKILNLVNNKYEDSIYNKVVNSNINNYTYIISDDKIDVYFNNINFEEEIPFITIDREEQVFNENTKKYIAFTFDDGPSIYTNNLLHILEKNNSSATFFMLGSKMKQYQEIILKIYNSESEIGSHTYSHRNLLELSKEEINYEINTTNIIYNAITKDNIKYIRPPYGNYNTEDIKDNMNVILWNIDTKDWLHRDKTKIYNKIINNACDGCIVLLHEIYPETLEAVNEVIPILQSLNYEIVSISKLIEYKNYDIYKNKVITSVK